MPRYLRMTKLVYHPLFRSALFGKILAGGHNMEGVRCRRWILPPNSTISGFSDIR